MVNPVPGFNVSTQFHARGARWSCSKNSKGEGVHTGADIAAAVGTPVVAARPGVTAHVDYSKTSKAFGSKQLVVRCDDGTEDFYAHMSSRVGAGIRVAAGDRIGAVGKEGTNVTGPHLHFERHRKQGFWKCDNCISPQPSLNFKAEAGAAPAEAGGGLVKLSKLRFGQRGSDSVRRLQRALNNHRLSGGQRLPITGNYLEKTDQEVRLCQQQHGFGNDPPRKSFVGPRQAQHLFASTGDTIAD